MICSINIFATYQLIFQFWSVICLAMGESYLSRAQPSGISVPWVRASSIFPTAAAAVASKYMRCAWNSLFKSILVFWIWLVSSQFKIAYHVQQHMVAIKTWCCHRDGQSWKQWSRAPEQSIFIWNIQQKVTLQWSNSYDMERVINTWLVQHKASHWWRPSPEVLVPAPG